MTLRQVNLITVLAKSQTERRKGRKFHFWMWEENLPRIIPGKTCAVR